jgi:hypothetical protein
MKEVDRPVIQSLEEVVRVKEDDVWPEQEEAAFTNTSHFVGSSSDLLFTANNNDDNSCNNDNDNSSNGSNRSGHRKCTYCSISLQRIQQSCFLVGSLLSTISSTIDFCDAIDDDDETQKTETPAPTSTKSTDNDPLAVWDASKLFMTLSTLLYLMDSLIHIMVLLWWKTGSEHEHLLRQIDNDDDNDATVAIVTQHQNKILQPLLQPLLESYDSYQNDNRLDNQENLINLVSSHNQHHDPNQLYPSTGGGDDDDTDSVRSTSASWTFSVLFGIAATFDLLSSITEDDADDDNDDDNIIYPWPSFVFGTLCVDLFWASAIIVLWNKRRWYYDHFFFPTSSNNNIDINNDINNDNTDPTDSDWLLLLGGDILYLVGCTVDVIVNLADNPIRHASWMMIATASLFSSLCWFVVAMLYTWADSDIFDTGAIITTTTAIPSLTTLYSSVTTSPINV